MSMNRPLNEAEILQIVEDEQFWEDCNSTENSEEDENIFEVQDRVAATEAMLDEGDRSEPGESDHEEISEHDSDSELEWHDNEQESEGAERKTKEVDEYNRQAFYGKDKAKWSKNAPTREGEIADRSSLLPSFIIQTKKIEAFIGLLYLTGILKSGHEDLRSLWANDGTGRDIFRCTMSLARFSFLLSCIRFDDDSTRKERLKENKLAAISELFNQFVHNSKSCYSPFLHLTIDEMLVPFRGCCGFRMFMPSKPAKYGIKIQVLADAKTHYMVNTEIYCGKQTPSKACLEKGEKLSLPTQVVMRLIEPVKGSNRNITTDNWYTSLELANALKKEKLTLVGTLRKNKAFIPPEFLPSRGKEIGSSLFGFTSDLTIVAHVPKKNKSVILLSSMHSDDKVDEKSKKPDIILFYNSTKAGVDALDQKCANYSTSRRTRRWPMAIFHMILNVSGVNARVLYQLSPTGKELTRIDFLKTLAKELCRSHVVTRISNPKISLKLRNLAANIFDFEISHPLEPQPRVGTSKRKRCAICPSKKKHLLFDV
ncbi:piggyBac transposable element-derived protein 3-like [Harmonia axyridis]|uniref:piggyBac transposable element-derived protein 3-like n=1 Tax=Harmonia axyridis TaxID=115357 RepID=UPI001E276AB8|nr:piggyBac transposable element-derived protein 3-like [Harmonia axyridis]